MNPKTTSTPAREAAPVPADATLILDAAAIDRALKRIAHEIIERNPELKDVAIVGIPLRGVEIARRLAAHLTTFGGVQPFCGVIDVSMHRDDIHTRRKLWPVQPSQLPHDLAGATIVLTDDVLFSGRTCRAAMDAISSFGRPARIQYATLVDRGHRELPIRADYVGKNLPTSRSERVFVRFAEVDGVEADSVWLDHGGPQS